jgi:Arc/MetJ-type ribon-helix-helix transcriptional regulator
MRRLHVSLSQRQREFLDTQAQRTGVSVAEVVRQLVAREQQREASTPTTPESIWSIVGIGTEEGELIDQTPVSASPDLYLYGPSHSATRTRRKRK